MTVFALPLPSLCVSNEHLHDFHRQADAGQRDLAIELRNLCRTYDGEGGVRDVSLSVPKGAIYVLCGANGSGKSTALSVLVGLLFSRHGSLRFNGMSVPLDRMAARAGLGFLPDTPIVDNGLTGWQWASFVAGIKGTEWPTSASDAAKRLTLPLDAIDRPVRSLSFGTKRKLALWVEMMTTTSVLVLDEPLVGLDPPSIEGFYELARDWVALGRSMLLSTHLLREADGIATHVGILRDGISVADGPIRDIAAGRPLAQVFRHLTADA
ncbi:MAG: ABC transporter ATP-binding protein [bacterium]